MEQQVTGTLTDGRSYRATVYAVEILDADGTVVEMIDLSEVTEVRRDGLDVTFKRRKGKSVTLRGATIADAGRLETTVRPAIPQAPAKSGRGLGGIFKWGCLGTVAIIALVVIATMLTSGGSDDGRTSAAGSAPTAPAATVAGGSGSAGTTEPATTEEPAASASNDQMTAIGERVQAGVWALTVHEVIELEGDTFLPVPEGKRWIAVDLTLENESSKAEPVSSLLQFAVRDADGRKYTLDIGAQTAAGATQPDGEIAAGDKLRAPIAFEVPADASGLIFVFEPNVFSTKDTIRVALD